MITATEPSTAGPPAVEFRHISHTYATRRGDTLALNDISFTVPPGTFTCIVGPSGCGKSTLLNLVAGLAITSEGDVLIDHRSLRGTPDNSAFVFQQPALFPWKTVLGNVTAGLRARGMDRATAKQRALAQLDAVGLADFANRHPHELSGGMAQRVGIARALALEPRLLLMDEPFAAVDAQTRIQLQSELLRLMGEQEMTVLFVTHDVGEAVYLGDQVLVLTARPGRVLVHQRLDPASSDRASEYFAVTTAQITNQLLNTEKRPA